MATIRLGFDLCHAHVPSSACDCTSRSSIRVYASVLPDVSHSLRTHADDFPCHTHRVSQLATRFHKRRIDIGRDARVEPTTRGYSERADRVDQRSNQASMERTSPIHLEGQCLCRYARFSSPISKRVSTKPGRAATMRRRLVLCESCPLTSILALEQSHTYIDLWTLRTKRTQGVVCTTRVSCMVGRRQAGPAGPHSTFIWAGSGGWRVRLRLGPSYSL